MTDSSNQVFLLSDPGATEKPLSEALLSGNFYSKLDERTDDLPLQMVTVQSRKIDFSKK